MKIKSLGVVLFSSVIAHVAYAAGQGDTQVNVGWAHFVPNDSSKPLTVTAMGQTSTVSGSGTELEKSDTAEVLISHFFTDNVAVETALGEPPTLRLKGKGTLESVGELGSAKVYAPLIEATYYFNSPKAMFRPFVGAGATYIWYKDIKLSPTLASGEFLASPATGNALVGPTSAKVTTGLAPVVTGGLSFQLTDKLSIRYSATWTPMDINTTLTTQSQAGVVTSKTKSTLNAVVSFLSIGYTF